MFKKLFSILLVMFIFGRSSPVGAAEYGDNSLKFDTSRLEEENEATQQKSDLAKNLFSSQEQKQLEERQGQVQLELEQQGSLLFADENLSLNQGDQYVLFQEQSTIRRVAVTAVDNGGTLTFSSIAYLILVLGLLALASYVSYRIFL